MPFPEDHAISPSDPRIESDMGMERDHARRLLAFCDGRYMRRQLIVIARASSAASLPYHGLPGHHPKPSSVKDIKIGDRGRVPHPAKPGAFLISDYDLHGVYAHQGVYRRSDGSGVDSYVRLYVNNNYEHGGQTVGSAERGAPHVNDFLRAINQQVCSPATRDTPPELQFFQHGSEDDYRGPGGVSKSLTDPDPSGSQVRKHYLVFEHTGALYLLPAALLHAYYRHRHLSWLPGW